jgi:hypothetical protein
MATTYYFEQLIRDKCGTPCNKMLSLFHELSGNLINYNIDVVIIDKTEVPWITVDGEFNTAFPTNELIPEKTVLAVVVNSVKRFDPLIVSHEIAHWVLKLQGYSAYSYNSDAQSNISIFFNSMLQHPAIYKLQIDFGDNPFTEVSARTQNDINLLRQVPEKIEFENQLCDAFYFADDLINEKNPLLKLEFTKLLREKYPQTNQLIEKILITSKYYDITEKKQNKKFALRLMKNLKIGNGNFAKVDNIIGLSNLISNSGFKP